ncbi:MAG: glycosyltransferase family 2 protein [Bacteroidetes bacterium]|nr:glycosyltransferase family 2 protein [Bacteroidota bacterium]MCH8326848.1 glycosyltransferase family 2 protein [Bacteroidota bacterium]
MERNIKPKVSVIIATFNSSHTLHYTIKSLLNQTFQDFEAWIIGDCCTDDTEQIITDFNDSRLNWYNRSVNSGSQPAPNNEGLKRAVGKYIAYLGHDDLWMPNHLKELVSHEETLQLEFTYSLTLCISPKGIESVLGKKFIGIYQMNFQTPPSSWLHKKELINKIGYWNENYLDLTVGPDMDFFRRAFSSCNKVHPLKKLTVLKFRSPAWKSYQNKEELTKVIKNYWERISANSYQLELELLNLIAFKYSQFHMQGMIIPPRKCIRMLMRYYYHYLKKHLLKIHIFKIFFNKYYLFKRKKNLIQRGLN